MKRKIIRLILIATLAFAVFKFILAPVWITGLSMEPTYHNGRLIFINRLIYLRRPPARGEVVAIRTSGLEVMYLKRVVALPGESLEIDNGLVKINGKLLAEPYVTKRQPWQVPTVTLEPDEYYVIGDNRENDAANHLFGRVAIERIVGRALW